MFSKELLEHFRNPRNAGALENATVSVEVSNPVCGDVLQVAARVADGKVAEAKFLCRGCTTSIACASRLTEMMIGTAAAELAAISAERIADSLGGIPAETFHGAQLAADAARSLASELHRK